jgi:hypothetical protein
MKTPEMSHIKYGFYGKKKIFFPIVYDDFPISYGKKKHHHRKKNP